MKNVKRGRRNKYLKGGGERKTERERVKKEKCMK
jgi:hypothetical protein